MSRFTYWTILIGNEPTAFRAADEATLKPTLVQLQRTHPDARLQWFERGRLWSSPLDAQNARDAERAARRRPPTWRPGGRHEDPRQKYKDAKKAKWTKFKDGIRKRTEERRSTRDTPHPPDHERPSGRDLLADWKPPPKPGATPARPPAGERPRESERPRTTDRPRAPERPRSTDRPRAAERPRDRQAPSGKDLLADWKPPRKPGGPPPRDDNRSASRPPRPPRPTGPARPSGRDVLADWKPPPRRPDGAPRPPRDERRDEPPRHRPPVGKDGRPRERSSPDRSVGRPPRRDGTRPPPRPDGRRRPPGKPPKR